MLSKKQNKILYQYNNRSLVPLKREHIFKLKQWRNAQMNTLRQSELLTDSDQEKWYSSLERDKTQSLFALMVDNQFVGYCGLTYIDHKNKRAEVSFLVETNRSKQKQIYREDFLTVLYMLCKYGFEELNLNKLFTETFDFRREHIKILEDFGLFKEGELREDCFCRGKYFNSFIHSILLSDWKLIRKTKKYAMDK